MSTLISNISSLPQLQSLQPNRRISPQPVPLGTLTQNRAFVVTIQGSQGTGATQDNHGFYRQRKIDLAQLGQALRSGDAEGAQQAYDALVALGHDGPFKNGETFHRSDRAEAFSGIGNALASGDLAGAISAFNNLAITFGDEGSTVGGLIPTGPEGPPIHIPPAGTLPPTIIPVATKPLGPPTIAPPLPSTNGGPSGPPEINLPSATNFHVAQNVFQQILRNAPQPGSLSLSI
jgi:hypothetical protein